MHLLLRLDQIRFDQIRFDWGAYSLGAYNSRSIDFGIRNALTRLGAYSLEAYSSRPTDFAACHAPTHPQIEIQRTLQRLVAQGAYRGPFHDSLFREEDIWGPSTTRCFGTIFVYLKSNFGIDESEFAHWPHTHPCYATVAEYMGSLQRLVVQTFLCTSNRVWRPYINVCVDVASQSFARSCFLNSEGTSTETDLCTSSWLENVESELVQILFLMVLCRSCFLTTKGHNNRETCLRTSHRFGNLKSEFVSMLFLRVSYSLGGAYSLALPILELAAILSI